MNAAELLIELDQAGVTLQVLQGNRLGVPTGVLTDDQRDAIRNHKPELLALLQPTPVPRYAQAPGGGLSWQLLKTDPDSDWRPLANTYYVHHCGCLHCIATGQNPQLQRCPVGKSLWDVYNTAIGATTREARHHD